MHPYSPAWGRGGPLDQTPAPGATPYQSYVDQYRALNDAWYDSWLNPAPPPVAEPSPSTPPSAAPAVTPYTAPPPVSSGEGYGGGLGYGSVPGTSGGNIADMFSGPTGALFGDETFADLEPGMLGFGGVSIGTGLTEMSPTAELHDVAVMDPGALAGGMLGSAIAGPLGGLIGGYGLGFATPEIALGSLGRFGSVIDVLSAPSNYSSTAVNMAQRAFANPPQLDLSGGPMGMGIGPGGAGMRGGAPDRGGNDRGMNQGGGFGGRSGGRSSGMRGGASDRGRGDRGFN